jgi:hypothetical protein
MLPLAIENMRHVHSYVFAHQDGGFDLGIFICLAFVR